MSRFSGKCDLYDHIGGLGGWYDRDGNPVEFGSGVGAYYSDEYQDFLAFKEKTGGVMYQHKVITVTPWNHEEVERLCKDFKAIKHTRTIPDKRKKSGQREETYYTYQYWEKEYTLKEINQHGVYITVEIHFNTLLDIIPYYPYIVCACCSDDNKQTVWLSNESFVDSEMKSHLKSGWYSNSWQWYKKKLQDHYREIVLKYFNPEGREHIEEVEFDPDLGIGKVSKPIDENFGVEWRWADGKIHEHWTSPHIMIAKDGMIEMSKQDLEQFLGTKALVYYVEAKEHELDLG